MVQFIYWNIIFKNLLIKSRNVNETMRLVPQLNTVANEIARPFKEVGKISLNTSQETEKILNVLFLIQSKF